jgi:hypothetical protein
MRATLLKLLLPNPGLPGFAHFGMGRFADSGPLAQTALPGLPEPGDPENFPAGKFCSLKGCASDLYVQGGGPEHPEIPKTFLQESFSRTLALGVSRIATADEKGGQLMPATQ